MKFNHEYQGDYIQGKFCPVKDPNSEIKSLNPGDLNIPVVCFPCRFEHVNEAVDAAKKGFLSWEKTPLSDRFSAISRYKELLEKRTETLSYYISFEIGKPLWESRREVNDTVQFIEDFLKNTNIIKDIDVEDSGNQSKATIKFFPQGIMAVFGSTDLPSFGTHRFLIPSLGLGNTVVLKSAKYSPMVCQFLAQTFHEAGFPPGVFNLIHGDFEIGRRMATHSEVDGILFTGTYEKGLKLKKQAVIDPRKILICETGGKNSTLIWNDCSYEKALSDTFFACNATTGQRHASTRRILVHEKIFDKFVSDFHTMSKQCSIGYGLSENKEPFMGPLISEKSVEMYLRFQGIATREGAEEIMRGKALERETQGYYVSPSIHLVIRPNPEGVYEKSEIFGPNAAIYKVSNPEEAIEFINQSKYGLVCSIYSSERKLFAHMVETVKVGTLFWNLPTVFLCNNVPFVGMKKSGNLRPLGSFAKYQCAYPLSFVEPRNNSDFPLPEQMPKIKS